MSVSIRNHPYETVTTPGQFLTGTVGESDSPTGDRAATATPQGNRDPEVVQV